MDAQTQEQVLALERMGVSALRQRYAEVFAEGTKVANKAWLVKRIAWRLQALAEGDLSERARKRVAELADADLRLNPPRQKREDAATEAPRPDAPPVTTPKPKTPVPAAPAPAGHDPRLPPPGSVITRRYKGRDVQVLILADGFSYQGQTFPSLSAVAKAVTGQHQNGFLFFKLNKGGDK
jgi:hypothetical protein